MTKYDFYLTEEDKKETSKLMEEVIEELKEKRLIENNNDYETKEDNILFFIHLKNKIVKPGKYRDKDKNLIEILEGQDFGISLESNINKNGVGDGKEPKIARTYSIKLWFIVNKKDYHKQKWYNKELGFYIYDRSLKKLIKKFNDRIEIKTLDFITKLELKKEG